jgi:hypothetical protein
VVDAQPAAVPHRGGPQPGDRGVAGVAQSVGHEGRQAPVLAGPVELVGWRPDAHAVGEQVLHHPGVGPVGIDADGQVDEQGRRLLGPPQLLVEEELHPCPEPDEVGVGRRERRDRRLIGVAVVLGPLVPAAVMVLGEGAEPRVGLEVGAHLCTPPVEPQVGPAGRPQRLERPPLERPHLVADYQRGVVQPAAVDAEPRDGRRAGGPRHILDAQGQRVAPPAAGREVRAGLDAVER